jgi:3-methyl-2-oxobutanoate hydroxymethyltransferase
MTTDKVTVTGIQKKKGKEKITVLTAYDFPLAQILDQAGIEIILVGDSLGNVILGYPNTIPVTMEDMIHHTKAVARGCSRSLLIADMPFMSYQISVQEAVRNAGRLIQEGGAEGVKLEGGVSVKEQIKTIVQSGIPVMGHVGLTPQSVHSFGGYKVQGKGEEAAKKVLADAQAVEEAGAFSIVLEGIPLKLAKQITEKLKIPSIGIGAGPHCDGQVLVTYDLLGVYQAFTPKFVKRYVDLSSIIQQAINAYKEEVEKGSFPTEQYSFL